jgi:hypothetical protein
LEQKYGITGSAPALDFEDELQLAVLEALRERAVAGGVARAKKLSSKRKAVIAKQAAETRWAHLKGDADEQARRAKRAAQARARRAMQR